eukprot:TRINITY_DN18655_c0_g6_i1.p1 TRINITY_DN18655_c0_g6~~TRINITY_DN18655_c0_g6_i1.p1  ORF type:complete len:878 (+),score=238.05 TRINITY_DN18655_c0_g6_i1:118-2751(+)
MAAAGQRRVSLHPTVGGFVTDAAEDSEQSSSSGDECGGVDEIIADEHPAVPSGPVTLDSIWVCLQSLAARTKMMEEQMRLMVDRAQTQPTGRLGRNSRSASMRGIGRRQSGHNRREQNAGRAEGATNPLAGNRTRSMRRMPKTGSIVNNQMDSAVASFTEQEAPGPSASAVDANQSTDSRGEQADGNLALPPRSKDAKRAADSNAAETAPPAAPGTGGVFAIKVPDAAVAPLLTPGVETPSIKQDTGTIIEDEPEADEPEGRTPWVFLSDSAFRTVWDLVYIVALLYEVAVFVFSMLTIGHGPDGMLIRTDGPALAVRVILSVFWMLDIPVQMRTARIIDWEIVEDPQRLLDMFIGQKQLHYHLVMTFPLDLIFSLTPLPPICTYVAMVLRLLRLRQVPTLLRPAAPTKDFPRWAECVIFTFWFLIGCHMLACIWIACAQLEEQGVPDGMSLDSDAYTVYMISLYYVCTTVTSVGYGDISPTANNTRWFNMFLQMCGVAVLMLVSGRTGAYFITTDPFKLAQIERRRRLESLMANENIPWSVQKEAFTIYPSLLEAGKRDYQSILEELPIFIRDKVTRHMKIQLIGNVPMFKGLSKTVLTHLADVIIEDYCGSQEFLIEAGQDGHEMYTLSQGMVEVLIPDKEGNLIWAANLKAGSWFGEIALLKKTTRTASIRSVTSCVLYKLEKADFDTVLAGSQELRRRLHLETERRMKQTVAQAAAAAAPPGPVVGVVGSHSIDQQKAERKGLAKVVRSISMMVRKKSTVGSGAEGESSENAGLGLFRQTSTVPAGTSPPMGAKGGGKKLFGNILGASSPPSGPRSPGQVSPMQAGAAAPGVVSPVSEPDRSFGNQSLPLIVSSVDASDGAPSDGAQSPVVAG